MILEPEEWKSIKNKVIESSPYLLLIIAVLAFGYSVGWHMKGSDVVMDCKYANSFRVHTDSFNCQRKV
jgi:hypothetical protein